MPPQEAAEAALLDLEDALKKLNAAELTFSDNLDLYRRQMTPLFCEAAFRISGEDRPSAHMMRLFLADSYLAQEHMRNAVRHTTNACEMARALKKHLS